MNEHGFVKAVHRHLSPDTYKWKIHDTYTGGVPDAMYAGPACLLFVEYKFIQNLPKRKQTPIKTGLSALQEQWLEKMFGYKVVVMVIIGSNQGVAIVSEPPFGLGLKKTDFYYMTAKDVAHHIDAIVQGYENGLFKITNPSAKLAQDLGSKKS